MISEKALNFYIHTFTSNFVLPEYIDPWRFGLANTDNYSTEISGWDFWDDDVVYIDNCKEINSYEDIVKNEKIIKALENLALVISIGHDSYSLSVRLLKEIVFGEVYLLEGIVIVDPTHLCLVYNHDGGIKLCSI